MFGSLGRSLSGVFGGSSSKSSGSRSSGSASLTNKKPGKKPIKKPMPAIPPGMARLETKGPESIERIRQGLEGKADTGTGGKQRIAPDMTNRRLPMDFGPGSANERARMELFGRPQTLGPESFSRPPVRLPMPPAMQQPRMQQSGMQQQPGYAAGTMAQLGQMQQSPRNNFEQLRGMLNRPIQEAAQQMQQPVPQQQPLQQVSPQQSINQIPQEETEEERKRKLAGLNLNVL